MLKREELSNPNSCLSRSADDEMLFVLRGHDVTFSAVVRFWADERIRRGKNLPGDAQINEAWAAAALVEQESACSQSVLPHASPERVSGHLEIGITDQGDVVINHPRLDVDAPGMGHIIFSPRQARGLAALLFRKATEAENEVLTKGRTS